jgi:hypothetical protein
MLKEEALHRKETNKQMEIDQKQITKIQQEGFDEETKQKIQACLDEIDRKQQHQQQKISYKTKYIRFASDRERKLLLFTGKFDKKEMPQTDFQTGEVIPGKYKMRYSFECYDITTSTIEESQANQSEPSIWERGTADARTILYYLSKDKNILEVIRNGHPFPKCKSYQVIIIATTMGYIFNSFHPLSLPPNLIRGLCHCNNNIKTC